MLWSAGLEAPRHVWVHGWLLAQGERMSKSMGNFLEPVDVVKTLGGDGARYVMLREVAFDRDTDVSWDSFVRRYNADLANDFGNLLNRTISMANRYFEGERPAVGPSAGMAAAWTGTLATYRERIEGCLLHEALAALWEFVGAANRLVDAEQPWVLAKASKAGDEDAGNRLKAVIGDLVEACRLVSLAVAPFMPQAAPRALAQLGYEYGYAADGNHGPAILDDLVWGARSAEAGRVGAAEPLFPRLETEAATPAAG
jgi:methionyl-tRNA synthetase